MVRGVASGGQPNLYQLSGEDGSEIVYSTTTITGEPEFSYQGPLGENAFSGELIDVLETALGTEVTVVMDRVADGDTTLLTLIVPPVDLGEEPSLQIDTFAVVTTQGGGFGGPAPGQLSSYAVTRYVGPAKSVKS
jgi:hypothetical protein